MKKEIIAAVQRVPVIWDKRHKHHHNRHILKREWEKIGMQLGTSDQNVRHVWKNVRQEFGKQLKKTLSSEIGSPEDHYSSWPYFESMQFLTDQFLPLKSSVNVNSVLKEMVFENNDEDTDEFEAKVNTCDSFETESEIQSASCTLNDGSENSYDIQTNCKIFASTLKSTDYVNRATSPVVIEQKQLDSEQDRLQNNKCRGMDDSNDEDVGFFNSLLPHVRKLSPRDKMRFRMQVHNILFDMVYPPEQPMSAATTPS